MNNKNVSKTKMSNKIEYAVKNVRVSLLNLQKHQCNNQDIKVYQQYVSKKIIEIVILNRNQKYGWVDTLEVLIEIFDPETKNIIKTKIVKINPCDTYKDTLLVKDNSFNFEKSEEVFDVLSKNYGLLPPVNLDAIDIDGFNKIFDSEIQSLPQVIFAVGIDKNKNGHVSGKFHRGWFEIISSINFFNQVLLTYYSHLLPYYYLVAHTDGYVEGNYLPNDILYPHMVTKEEFQGTEQSIVLNGSFPIFHKKKWILTQCAKKNVPYVEPIPDRYFFHMNYYKGYQGIGKGIPFTEKVSKIVYAGKYENGSVYKHNFVNRRDIDKNQRIYLFEDAKSPNLVGNIDFYISMEDQIEYKYILDIDGVTATWDAKAWKLASGSVLFLTESSWRHWYQDLLVPWVNHISIKDDFSNLDEMFEWCENHPQECVKIAYEGKLLFDKVFNLSYMIEHVKSVISKIN
jgi:hypothetical protein